jgi:hypothetical protein
MTRHDMSVDIKGPGVTLAIANFKRSAFDRFEHNERLRYSGLAKERGIAVTADKVTLGECVGLRWLAKHPDKISGHYLLRQGRAFVLEELFRADTEKVVQEVEAALATISIQP